MSNTDAEPKLSDYKLLDPRTYIAADIQAKYARWDELQKQLPEELQGIRLGSKKELVKALDIVKSWLNKDTEYSTTEQKQKILSDLESLSKWITSQTNPSACMCQL